VQCPTRYSSAVSGIVKDEGRMKRWVKDYCRNWRIREQEMLLLGGGGGCSCV